MKNPKTRRRIGLGAVAALGAGWAIERFTGVSLPSEAISAISGVLDSVLSGL